MDEPELVMTDGVVFNRPGYPGFFQRLERQHVAHLRPVAELDVLLAERLEQAHDFRVRQLGEGEIVAWCVAHHARHAVGAPALIDARRRLFSLRRRRSHTGVIVVEDVDRLVIGIARAAHTRVAWTEIAGLDVFWRPSVRRHSTVPMPRTILTMGSNNHPLFAERMPPLFPGSYAGALH